MNKEKHKICPTEILFMKTHPQLFESQSMSILVLIIKGHQNL